MRILGPGDSRMPMSRAATVMLAAATLMLVAFTAAMYERRYGCDEDGYCPDGRWVQVERTVIGVRPWTIEAYANLMCRNFSDIDTIDRIRNLNAPRKVHVFHDALVQAGYEAERLQQGESRQGSMAEALAEVQRAIDHLDAETHASMVEYGCIHPEGGHNLIPITTDTSEQ